MSYTSLNIQEVIKFYHLGDKTFRGHCLKVMDPQLTIIAHFVYI